MQGLLTIGQAIANTNFVFFPLLFLEFCVETCLKQVLFYLQDLLTIGQAIANTTSYITKRIDRVETSTLVIKNEMGLIFNGTRFILHTAERVLYKYGRFDQKIITHQI